MRIHLVAAIILLCSAAVAMAEDGIPLETVQKLKDSTVYVKIEAAGQSGSASGFVIRVDGNSALVVTNHHVIEPEIVEIHMGRGRIGPPAPFPFRSPFSDFGPSVTARACKDAKATVVLYSGTPKEESVDAKVLAADPDLDLAILKISNVKKMPTAIEYCRDLKLVETMPVYIFGFPFGKLLATGEGSPAITVGKGSISSLRLDAEGQLSRVQIDGALNPGNSGGPVVDARGRLVGIAVATISNSSGIGLTIPAEQLSLMFQGRLGKPQLHASRGDAGQLVINVEIALIDPLHKMKSVTLDYLAASQVGEPPQPTERLSKLHGCRKLPLQLDGQLASGHFSPKNGITEVRLYCQAVGVLGDREQFVTKNVAQTIGLSSIGTMATARPFPGGPPIPDDSKGPQTMIVGGGGRQFTDAAPQGGVLVGFQVGLGKWGNNDVIHTIRPIFRTSGGHETLGTQHGTESDRVIVVKAKRGYAVGSITTKSMALVDGFSITFMKVVGQNGLDSKKHYQSEWVGGKGGGPEVILGGDGTLVIGIVGRETGNVCTAMGLLRKQKQ